ncbi:MAG: hypothetical protein ABW036_02735 [Flavitalea sp.]
MSSKLQYRFSQYEVQPPQEAWANIASRLDSEYNEAEAGLSERILDLETPAPAGIWNRIADELNDEKSSVPEVPVVPLNPSVESNRENGAKVLPFTLRRVAAVGVILLGITALWYFATKPDQDTPQLVSVTPQSKQPGSNASVVPDAVINAPVIAENRTRKNNNRSTVKFASNISTESSANEGDDKSEQEEPENDNITYSNVSHAEKSQEQTISVTTQPIRDKEGNIIMNEKLVSSPDVNYVTVTAPNGEQTRMSKKFLEALGYMNSTMVKDDYPGLMLQEGSSWKWLFQEWRNKLLKQPSFIPTATNFLDIMELKEMLHENF